MFEGHSVVAVVAIGKNRELGNADKLLWHIPDDLKRFKQLTKGHPVIMGRKTFESIVSYIGKLLPDRTNIVVTRDPDYRGPSSLSSGKHQGPSLIICGSLEEALRAAETAPGSEEIHIGGGAQMYEQSLPYLDKLYLTLVDDALPADTFFPPYAHLFTEVSRESREYQGLNYSWVGFERN